MERSITRRLGALAFGLLLAGVPARVLADTVTFAPGQYDNTKNTVGAAPTYPLNNLQTTGVFRDVFWWRDQADGKPFANSADYINSGQNLVACGSAACDNGSGAYTALNFTGPNQSLGFGVTYLSLYDQTPTDEATTKDTFDAAVPGGLTISADVLFATDHGASGGVVLMYNEGQDGLALLVDNAGNTDTGSLRLVFQSADDPIDLVLATTSPVSGILLNRWYEVSLNVVVSGGMFTATGTIKGHSTPTDPNSAPLLATIATLNFTGSLANPDAGKPVQNAFVLSNPGEIGVMALGRVSIDRAGCAPFAAGGTYTAGSSTNPDGSASVCADNVGVSITNFTFPGGTTKEITETPEPGTMLLLGTGLLGLAALARRKR